MTVSQPQFRAALLDAGRPVPDGLIDGAARPAGKRFDVYRNNVAVSLSEAMRTAFPVITKLLGVQNMDGLAGMFLRAHPPSSPLMMHYGAAFPEFLAALPQLQHLPYLSDIARLELAIRRSYHAADAEAVDPDTLAAIAPDTLMQARIRLAPAVRVLRSDWPLHDIWRFNSTKDAPKPRAVAQDVLITRPGFDPIPEILPPGGAAFVQALASGATPAGAHAAADTDAPGFDPGPVLTLLLQGGAIIHIATKD